MLAQYQSPPFKGNCPSLSPRERQVLELLAQGYLYKKIADPLTISIPTANTNIRNIHDKLHVHSRCQAIARYPHQIAPRHQ